MANNVTTSIRVIRNRCGHGVVIDVGTFPCPRCRENDIENESGMAGQMATCKNCGARSSLSNWNDGLITMDKIPNKSHFQVVHELFKRPPNEVVEKTNVQGGRFKLYDEVTEHNKLVKEQQG